MLTLFVNFLPALVFCAAHLFVGRLRFLEREPHQTNWFSFAGGTALSYVFVYLMPKLAEKQPYLEAAAEDTFPGFLKHHIYLLSLGGLLIYFGSARAAHLLEKMPPRRLGPPSALRLTLKYADVGSHAAYSLLIGYLCGEVESYISIGLFTGAMALHFVAINHGLLHRYPHLYNSRIRWILVTATLAGWALGEFIPVDDLIVILWTALLAGGIIGNCLREELPAQANLRFWPLFLGAAFYTICILAIDQIEKG